MALAATVRSCRCRRTGISSELLARKPASPNICVRSKPERTVVRKFGGDYASIGLGRAIKELSDPEDANALVAVHAQEVANLLSISIRREPEDSSRFSEEIADFWPWRTRDSSLFKGRRRLRLQSDFSRVERTREARATLSGFRVVKSTTTDCLLSFNHRRFESLAEHVLRFVDLECVAQRDILNLHKQRFAGPQPISPRN